MASNLADPLHPDRLRARHGRGSIEKLYDVHATEDLTARNAKVDGERLEASQLAEDYLKESG